MEVISRYTRKQALDDGVLVDVSKTASEAGINHPVAFSRALFERCVAFSESVPQDASRTTSDILRRLRGVILTGSGRERMFNVCVRFDPPDVYVAPLKAVCGHGDNGEPVITVMLPEED